MLSPDLAGKQPGPDVGRPLHHAAVYHLALARAGPLQQRGHDAEGAGEAPAREVREQVDRRQRVLGLAAEAGEDAGQRQVVDVVARHVLRRLTVIILDTRASNKGSRRLREDVTINEKAPTPTSHRQMLIGHTLYGPVCPKPVSLA